MSWKDSKVHLLGAGLRDPWKGEPPCERIMPPPPPPATASASNTKVPSSSSSTTTTVSNRVVPNGVSSTTSSSSSEEGSIITSSPNATSIEFDGNDQVLCRVCGDKASGFHYGVHSCEGCKGFFRRSIQQKIQYRPCTKNQQCNILRINRNRCQYCRLKKCIAAGMSRDAVRFGRVPKREKAKILAAMQSSRMKTQEAKVLSEMSDDSKIIEEIVRAHYDNCDYTRNKMEPFLARAKENPIYVPCSGMTCPMKGRPEDSFLDQFSERFMDHVRQVCTFAKRIPGFECLHNDDKVTLLKSCVFEVLLVRLSGLFDNQSLVCLNGDIVRKETINQMPAGNAKFLMDSVFELAQRLNQFSLSDAEIGIFCAVVIITPDRPGLRNPELVQKMQSKLKNVLSNILVPQHSDSPGIFSELLSMVHDLRTLNTLHTDKFLQQCKINGSELVGGCSQQGPLQKHFHHHGVVWASGGGGSSQVDRESLGGGSPHSSSDAQSENDRRSPMGSVSSSESGCSSEVSRLTVQDLKVNNSVLLNALAASSSTTTTTGSRKRLNSETAAEFNPSIHACSSKAPLVAPSSATNTARCPFKSRKLDSPSDSGIDSPKNLGNNSICSSPRSSSTTEDQPSQPLPVHKEDEEPESSPPSAVVPDEQHPLLKRALQQPPQAYSNPAIPPNMLVTISHFQEEVYKPHKKFRRYNLSSSSSSSGSEDCHPSSSSSNSAVSNSSSSILAQSLLAAPEPKAKSLLASTLSKAAPLASDQCKRNEMLASLILDRQYFPPPPMVVNTRSPPPPPPIKSSASPSSSSSSYTSSAGEEEPSQPLNLSTRTPPPPPPTPNQQTSSNIRQHDIPTEA